MCTYFSHDTGSCLACRISRLSATMWTELINFEHVCKEQYVLFGVSNSIHFSIYVFLISLQEIQQQHQ
jgi:hypothetical protein